jgi:hypothetical protein
MSNAYYGFKVDKNNGLAKTWLSVGPIQALGSACIRCQASWILGLPAFPLKIWNALLSFIPKFCFYNWGLLSEFAVSCTLFIQTIFASILVGM